MTTLTMTLILCAIFLSTAYLGYKFGEIDGIKKCNEAKKKQILAMKKQIYLLKVKAL